MKVTGVKTTIVRKLDFMKFDVTINLNLEAEAGKN